MYQYAPNCVYLLYRLKALYTTRLPFGIASAPAIFQRLMENILQGIPSVVCYIDDILVTGTSENDHINEVLSRLEKHGFRLKQDIPRTLSRVFGAPHR